MIAAGISIAEGWPAISASCCDISCICCEINCCTNGALAATPCIAGASCIGTAMATGDATVAGVAAAVAATGSATRGAGGGGANLSAGSSASRNCASLPTLSRSSSRRRKRSLMPNTRSSSSVAWVSESESSPWSTKLASLVISSTAMPETSLRMRVSSCSRRGSRLMAGMTSGSRTGCDAVGVSGGEAESVLAAAVAAAAGAAARRVNQWRSPPKG